MDATTEYRKAETYNVGDRVRIVLEECDDTAFIVYGHNNHARVVVPSVLTGTVTEMYAADDMVAMTNDKGRDFVLMAYEIEPEGTAA